MKEVYVLLSDGDGNMHSIDVLWGAAVTTEKEAKAYVAKGGIGYTHSYEKVEVFESYEEARKAIYGKEYTL